MFYEPIRQLVGINNLIAAGKASGERVFEILDAPKEINEIKYPCPFPFQNNEITFSNVSFFLRGKKPCCKEPFLLLYMDQLLH